MKKPRRLQLTIVIMLLAAALQQSCSKVTEQLTYDLAMQTGTIPISVLPYSDTSTTVLWGSGSNIYNVDSFIKAKTGNTLGIKNVKAVTLTSCSISLTGADSLNNIANLQSCYTTFAGSSNTTPYTVSADSIANVYAISLVFPADHTMSFGSYISGSTFTYSLGGRLRRATTDTLRCTLQYTFNITVKG